MKKSQRRKNKMKNEDIVENPFKGWEIIEEEDDDWDEV